MSETTNIENGQPNGHANGQPVQDPEVTETLQHLQQQIIDTAASLETIPQQIRAWQYEGEDSLSSLGAIVQDLRDAQENLMVAKLRLDLRLPPPVDVPLEDDCPLTQPIRDVLREVSKERDEWGDYADLEMLGAQLHRLLEVDPSAESAEELVYESARSAAWFRNNGFPSEVTQPLAQFWAAAVKEANNYPQPASTYDWPEFRLPSS